MIFAQANPPAEIAAWLACAAFVVMLLNGGFKLTRNLKGADPQPPNSNLALSVQQLDRRMSALEDWKSELTTKMDDDKTEILNAGEHRAEKIHGRINDVLASVSELKGAVDQMRRNN